MRVRREGDEGVTPDPRLTATWAPVPATFTLLCGFAASHEAPGSVSSNIGTARCDGTSRVVMPAVRSFARSRSLPAKA